MGHVKISLADAATERGCSVDYLLAQAEAGHIDVFARIGPYTAHYLSRHGEPLRVLKTGAATAFPTLHTADTDDDDAENAEYVRRHASLFIPATNGEANPPERAKNDTASLAPVFGPVTVGGYSYTTLLNYEIAILRAEGQVTVQVVRDENAVNGERFFFSGDDEFLVHLTEPQTVGVGQLCLNLAPTDEGAAEGSADTSADLAAGTELDHSKPLQRSAAQDSAILAEIRALGLDPNALPPPVPGKAGVRARVRAALRKRDPVWYKSVFSSERVFSTSWQRLRDVGDISEAS